MYLCICLSPAIDATVRLSAWPADGCIIKDAVDTFAPGGKAVNVARWLAVRKRSRAQLPPSAPVLPASQDLSVACGGILGEDNAAPFEKELAKYGIEDRFVRVPGATRVNEMFVTPDGSFKVNRAAFPGVQRPDLPSFVSGLTSSDVVILSGSLPKGWPADTYRVLAEAAKRAGSKVVLDTSGAALVEGAKAHPDVIKPNAEECEALVGFVPKTAEEFRRATAALKTLCAFPIVSDGGAGCWFDGAFVAAPEVEVLDTTAAGDTLLAEWCLSGNPRLAVAAGSAACTMPGGNPPDVALVEKLAGEMA